MYTVPTQMLAMQLPVKLSSYMAQLTWDSVKTCEGVTITALLGLTVVQEHLWEVHHQLHYDYSLYGSKKLCERFVIIAL